LFQAFVMLGPQLTLLIFATSPVMSAVLGWVFFQETLTGLQMTGILVTLAGVGWVIVGQENEAQKSLSKKDYLWGVLFAFLGAAGQALGLFTSKKGLVGGFPALSGQIIRVLAALVVIWLWTIAIKKGKETVQALRENPQALKYIVIASFIGPVVGVWFSLVSVQNTDLGIASTLQSLPPVFLIPIGYYLFKEKVTWQSVAGTLIALGGVAILFLT
jgi:drug/metabolite transporter (DMT)-like permease